MLCFNYLVTMKLPKGINILYCIVPVKELCVWLSTVNIYDIVHILVR